MRRSVKAWVLLDDDGKIRDNAVFFKRADAEGWSPNDGAPPFLKPHRCVVTYDDGRPSRSGAKRTKGGKRA